MSAREGSAAALVRMSQGNRCHERAVERSIAEALNGDANRPGGLEIRTGSGDYLWWSVRAGDDVHFAR